MSPSSDSGKAAWDELVSRVLISAQVRREAEERRLARYHLEVEAVTRLASMLAFVPSLPSREPTTRTEIVAVVHGRETRDPSSVSIVRVLRTTWSGVANTVLLRITIVATDDGRVTYSIDDELVPPEYVYGALAACVEHWYDVPAMNGLANQPHAPADRLITGKDDVIPF